MALSVKGVQYTMSSIYCGLGGWCMLHPPSVMKFSMPGVQRNRDTQVLTGCFGAQACLVGTLWAGSEIRSPRTFYLWAALMLPFLAFDAWAYRAGLVNFQGFLLDLVPNLVQAGLALYAARLLEQEKQQKKPKQASS